MVYNVYTGYDRNSVHNQLAPLCQRQLNPVFPLIERAIHPFNYPIHTYVTYRPNFRTLVLVPLPAGAVQTTCFII